MPGGRRSFIRRVAAAALLPIERIVAQPPASQPAPIRTITAGAPLTRLTDVDGVNRALSTLAAAKEAFERAGYEVQTLRLALPPLVAAADGGARRELLDPLRAIDRLATDAGVLVATGPVLIDDREDADLPAWVATLLSSTKNVMCSVRVASAERGVHTKAVSVAANVIAALTRSTPTGGDNFRFAAAANIPARTPFFPVAWHQGGASLALGLELAPVVTRAFANRPPFDRAAARLRETLDEALAPVERLAQSVARQESVDYAGIDPSPAPAGERSIGEAIESLTGVPIGSASTLRACGLITEALKSLRVRTCGYAGLMLPVLEDTVLARRVGEHRYGLSELLLYSSICGTGLDVVPLPGDTSVDVLTAIVGDVAALSARLTKPLSARLCLVPGKKAGERAIFDNPHLVECVVMAAE
jgi:uncharacterized protein (UPF0210 family)